MALSLTFTLAAILITAVGVVWFVRSSTEHKRVRSSYRSERY